MGWDEMIVAVSFCSPDVRLGLLLILLSLDSHGFSHGGDATPWTCRRRIPRHASTSLTLDSSAR